MEYFDVVNEEENIIGLASRDECHSNPKLIHRACHFTLIDQTNKKILLTQRSFGKATDPGKLCFLGEHMLAGESWDEVVNRGIKEELGLGVIKYEEAAKNLFKQEKQTEIVRFFVILEWTGKIIFDQDELVRIEWLDLKSLVRDKEKYSEMTKFWVENTDWNKYL